jgi:hypothetical protein
MLLVGETDHMKFKHINKGGKKTYFQSVKNPNWIMEIKWADMKKHNEIWMRTNHAGDRIVPHFNWRINENGTISPYNNKKWVIGIGSTEGTRPEGRGTKHVGWHQTKEEEKKESEKLMKVINDQV